MTVLPSFRDNGLLGGVSEIWPRSSERKDMQRKPISTVAKPSQSRWIDISVTLHNGMVHWPTDPPLHIERILNIEHGDSHTISQISTGSHAGTHIDAPAHLLSGGAGVDEMPLDVAVGTARVIEIRNPEVIQVSELEQHRIRRGERILFKTRNSPDLWRTDDFMEDYVYISMEAARYLVERGVRLVGIDYLSVGGYHTADGSAVHKILLGAGVWLVEGLNLSHIIAGRYEFICLPLRLENADGSPARAILRPK